MRWLLVALTVAFYFHILAFPEEQSLGVKISFLSLLYSGANLVGATMVAVLYGVPYAPLWISLSGSILNG